MINQKSICISISVSLSFSSFSFLYIALFSSHPFFIHLCTFFVPCYILSLSSFSFVILLSYPHLAFSSNSFPFLFVSFIHNNFSIHHQISLFFYIFFLLCLTLPSIHIQV
eukprot:UN03602